MIRLLSGLVPPWAWAAVLAVALVCAWLWHAGEVRAARKAGADEVLAQWRTAQVEEDRRHAARLVRHQEITDAEIARRQAADADRDRMRSALDRLRQQLAAVGAGPGAAPADGGPPASTDSGVLAELLGQCGERVRALAAEADATRGAGAACERAYNALTVD